MIRMNGQKQQAQDVDLLRRIIADLGKGGNHPPIV